MMANFYQALCTKFGVKPLILFVMDFFALILVFKILHLLVIYLGY